MDNWTKILQDYEQHCRNIAKASLIDINETADAKHKRIKYLEADYIRWFEYYFPGYAKVACAPFHRKAANAIINNTVSKTLLELFRGAGKSVHICLGIPLYLMAKGELKFMLLIGQNEIKAKKLLSDIQAQLKFNHRILNDYGKQFNYGDWSDGNFSTATGIRFQCLGFGQDPRGLREGENRPDYIVCDDLDVRKRCNNDKLMREAMEYITSTLWGCFDKGVERFVLANNRIHKKGILARLVELAKQSRLQAKALGIKSEYFHIKANALDANGEPTWTAKYTVEYWAQKKAGMPGRSWQREYMNNPVEDGTVFSADDILHKKMLQLRQYDSLIFYADLSYKDKGDFKAAGIIGKKGREFHAIYLFCRRCSRAVVAQWLYDLYQDKNLHKYSIRYMIEGLFAQDEFVNDFDMVGEDRGFYVPVVPDKEPKGNKFDRVESMAGYFERHNFYFNVDEQDSPDQIEIIDQILAFEKGSGSNDDGPDMLQSAITKLNKRTATTVAVSGMETWGERRSNRL